MQLINYCISIYVSIKLLLCYNIRTVLNTFRCVYEQSARVINSKLKKNLKKFIDENQFYICTRRLFNARGYNLFIKLITAYAIIITPIKSYTLHI